MLPFWIAVWSIFNPVTFIVVVALNTVVSCCATNETWRKNNTIIQNELLPLCKGSRFVYADYERSSINFSYDHKIWEDNVKLFISDSCDTDHMDFILNSNDYYYFLINKVKAKKAYFCRTNHNFENVEIVYEANNTISVYASGCDENFYYKISDNYYCLNLVTLDERKLKFDSYETQIVDEGGNTYRQTAGMWFDKCNKNASMFSLIFENDTVDIDENIIDSDVLCLIKKFKFQPKYHYSTSNISSILCYGNPSFGNYNDCLIIDIDIGERKVISYQLFKNVDIGFFNIYPSLTIG